MASRSLKNIHRLIEVATTDVPINEQFVSDLNFAIEKMQEKDSRMPSRTYKPSSMVCIRNMYFQIMGTPTEGERMGAVLSGIVQSGSDRHARIQEVISAMRSLKLDCDYIDVEKFIKMRGLTDLTVVSRVGFETKLYHKKLNISFMCDGIINYLGRYYILEIKTETVYKWSGRRGVAEEHFDQATTYSMCLGVDQVLFLYESRDTTDKKAYIYLVTDEARYAIISKIELCESYVKRLKAPPIPLDITTKACAYCNYKEPCKKLGKD